MRESSHYIVLDKIGFADTKTQYTYQNTIYTMGQQDIQNYKTISRLTLYAFLNIEGAAVCLITHPNLQFCILLKMHSTIQLSNIQEIKEDVIFWYMEIMYRKIIVFVIIIIYGIWECSELGCSCRRAYLYQTINYYLFFQSIICSFCIE